MSSKLILLVSIIGGLACFLGAILVFGGIYLVSLGGHPIYVILGGLIGAVGYFLIKKDFKAIPVVWAMLAVDLIWAFCESGTSFWQLVPRVMVPLLVVAVTMACSSLLEEDRNIRIKLVFTVVGTVLPLLAVVAIFIEMFVPHAEITATGEASPVLSAKAGEGDGADWPAWGRNMSGNKYAQFDQINRQNVKALKVAWVFRTGDMAVDGAEYQVTPLKVDDKLFLCTPRNIVIALDPSSGKEIWRYDPHMVVNASNKGWLRCRGVSYADTTTMPHVLPVNAIVGQGASDTQQAQLVAHSVTGPDCAKRIVTTTNDGRLFEVDSETGKLCTGFGDNGFVSLLDNLGKDADKWYSATSAPLVADGVIMVGGRIADNITVGESSGVVRGYDVFSGKQLWAWDASRGPRDSSPLPSGEVYARDTPNFWGTGAYDPKLGLAYFPTGNETPDFWTGNRHPYSDEYTDSLVAVDLRTGKEKWHFRTANNDQFDYDVMSQPILYDMPSKAGSTRPVVIQLTKRSEIFVLDRRTGEPVVPVENRPVPTDGMPGQRISPVQPFSALSVGVDPLKESDTWGISLFDQLYCRIQFRKLRWEGPWTPLNDKDNTLIWPGYYGGSNWGGGAIDLSTGTLILNDIRMAMWGRFLKREDAQKYGLLPSTEGEYSLQLGTPWGVERSMFNSPLGTPCFKPPFGSMTAIDLTTQKVKWQVPLGSIEDATIHGIFGEHGLRPNVYMPIGMPSLGGPMVTKGGLTFFHGSLDYYVRAFDSSTGKELWKDRLPVGGQGVPMTYTDKNHKQFVIVVDGGATRTGTNRDRGDYVIAYSLPN